MATKRETKQEKAERLMLKQFLDTYPNAKAAMKALTEKQNPELHDIVVNAIKPQLEKARMIGVQIGWNGALMSLEGECERCKDKEEILELLRKKKKETLDKLKMKDFDNNENEVNE